MPARLRLTLAVASVLAAAAVLGVALARVQEPPRESAQRAAGPVGVTGPQPRFAGAVRPPGIPPVEFALRDQDGRLVRAGDLRGRVVVLAFMYATCEDTCPLMAQQVRGALDQADADAVALAVSVDPAGDTPARARRFLRKQRLRGRMRFLLGSRARLAPVWRAHGIQPQGHDVEHSAHVVVLDRAGRQRVGFPAQRLTPEGLAHDVERLARERTT